MAWPSWPWLRKSCTSKFMILSSKKLNNSHVAVVLVGEWSVRLKGSSSKSMKVLLKTAKLVPLVWIIWNVQRQGVLYQNGCLEASNGRILWGDFWTQCKLMNMTHVRWVHPLLWIACWLGAWDTKMIWDNDSLVVSAKPPGINIVWLTFAFLKFHHERVVIDFCTGMMIQAVNVTCDIRTQGTLYTTTWLCFGFLGNEKCLASFDGGHFQMFWIFAWVHGSLENWSFTWISDVRDCRCKHFLDSHTHAYVPCNIYI